MWNRGLVLNQLLQFLSNQSETSHKCYRHIEVFLKRKKIISDKITAFLYFECLQFLAKTPWKVCIQFLSNPSETLHKCHRHIEDVQLPF